MPVSNLSAPAIFGFFATSPDTVRRFRMRKPPQLPFHRLVTNIFNAKARGRKGAKRFFRVCDFAFKRLIYRNEI
jgi:hypothetical protein